MLRSRAAGWCVFALLMTTSLPDSALLHAQAQTRRRPGTVESDKSANGIDRTRAYIKRSWGTLTRSMDRCETVADPKIKEGPIVYYAAGMPVPDELAQLTKGCRIRVQQLPKKITHAGEVLEADLTRSGVLYLPEPYVVPGGRFNEMYGWDSYFHIRGLLRDGHVDLARGMIENFFYEIESYGAILNANRTYYLSRSQPPFLTAMIRDVWDASPNKDMAWLKRAYEYAVRDHQMWTSEPYLAGDTGLSRYYDFGEGPVPEIADHETPYWQEVADHLVKMDDEGRQYLLPASGQGAPAEYPKTWPSVTIPCGFLKGSTCKGTEKAVLTRDFYKGDRAMRASGYDISFRFGPYSGSTHHFAPVCLNSLLYRAEQNLAQMAAALNDKTAADKWQQVAEQRKQRMDKYLWDAQRGMYFDWDFTTNKRSTYEYATTFFPLWVGAASAEQAEAVRNNLSKFEQPGGVMMSTTVSGAQWDKPYGWAPLQLIPVEGLRKYKFDDDANRLSAKFIRTVTENFLRDGTIREKYNMVTGSSETKITSGYRQNVVGFGWTNGVWNVLYDALPQEQQAAVRQEFAKPKAAATAARANFEWW